MVFRAIPLEPATIDLRDRAFDVEPSAHEIDIADAEASQLGPPKPAVRQDENGKPADARVTGELINLIGGEVTATPFAQRWQVHAHARVAGETSLANREVEYRAEHTVGLANRRAGLTVAG